MTLQAKGGMSSGILEGCHRQSVKLGSRIRVLGIGSQALPVVQLCCSSWKVGDGQMPETAAGSRRRSSKQLVTVHVATEAMLRDAVWDRKSTSLAASWVLTEVWCSVVW